MKKIFILVLLIICPVLVNAQKYDISYDEENYRLVSVSEKYYKTIYNYNSSTKYNYSQKIAALPVTIEISKEEYDAADESNASPFGVDVTGQTEYKKLTSSILENSSKYMYKAVLDWKKMPVVRSYDILAIGFNQNVKATNIMYNTHYCLNNGFCYDNSNYYVNKSSYGVGVSFKLPESSDVNVLKNTLTLYMDKNVSGATIKVQRAAADYSHAIKSISYNLSHSYSVNLNGISLNSDSNSYYDEISPVTAILNCNW